ncbi:hypothetical protein KJ765_01010 [Candidatus Micrarchaeota archaeon]|nr:hypothetical protein [Candidatus Micrarchaeota archaeon]
MEKREGKLDTSIDRLVEFIRLKKSTTVDEAARALSLSQKQVEEIAEVLAESGLIHLKYEFSGIRLSPQLVQKHDVSTEREPKDQSPLQRMNEIKTELDSVEGMLDFSQKDIGRRIDNITEHFRETERMDLENENTQDMTRHIDGLLHQMEMIQAKVTLLETKAQKAREEMKRFERELEMHGGKTAGKLTRAWRKLRRIIRKKT